MNPLLNPRINLLPTPFWERENDGHINDIKLQHFQGTTRIIVAQNNWTDQSGPGLLVFDDSGKRLFDGGSGERERTVFGVTLTPEGDIIAISVDRNLVQFSGTDGHIQRIIDTKLNLTSSLAMDNQDRIFGVLGQGGIGVFERTSGRQLPYTFPEVQHLGGGYLCYDPSTHHLIVSDFNKSKVFVYNIEESTPPTTNTNDNHMDNNNNNNNNNSDNNQFTAKTKLLFSFGTKEQLPHPMSVAVDENNSNILVGGPGSGGVQVFDKDGQHLNTIPTTMTNPSYVAWDRFKHKLYVSNSKQIDVYEEIE